MLNRVMLFKGMGYDGKAIAQILKEEASIEDVRDALIQAGYTARITNYRQGTPSELTVSVKPSDELGKGEKEQLKQVAWTRSFKG